MVNAVNIAVHSGGPEAQVDWLDPEVGGRLALSMHSSNDTDELTQWICHDDRAVNVDVSITIIDLCSTLLHGGSISATLSVCLSVCLSMCVRYQKCLFFFVGREGQRGQQPPQDVQKYILTKNCARFLISCLEPCSGGLPLPFGVRSAPPREECPYKTNSWLRLCPLIELEDFRCDDTSLGVYQTLVFHL